MNMKKQGFSAFLRRKQYVIAGAIVAVAAVGSTMLYSNAQEKEREQMEAELAAELKEEEQLAAEEETENAQSVSTVIPPKPPVQEQTQTMPPEANVPQTADAGAEAGVEQAPQTAATPEPQKPADTAQTAAEKNTLHFSPEDGLLWPMEGNVILNYSMDSTVYFPTLQQYKYNPAVIIEGEVNDKVYAVAEGKVTDISNSEETGCTMTVDLGDGYEAVYGQLKEPNFAKGDYVEAGHVVGFVAEPTKYYSVEGSNLYFALRKDGVPVDPVEFFE